MCIFMHVRACVGLKGSACRTQTWPSVFQVGDFVIFLHSDPQCIDTQMKPNMHMLSSFHTERQRQLVALVPSISLYGLFVLHT